jgi:hypothetical protein
MSKHVDGRKEGFPRVERTLMSFLVLSSFWQVVYFAQFVELGAVLAKKRKKSSSRLLEGCGTLPIVMSCLFKFH